MASLTVSNFTNVTMKSEAEDVFSVVIISLAIIINVIACPFTIGLNVLVIMAIKRRPTLQSNSNIMLACLAVTDVLTGLTSQPAFILWKTLFLLGSDIADVFSKMTAISNVVLSYSSALHLMMVVGEKLIAIKYPFWYPYIVTTRNIKMGVFFCWAYSTSFGIPLRLINGRSALFYISVSHILFACVAFVSCSYLILYFETRRHQKMIKAQQLPQEQVEKVLKENKALKTTVLVVGSIGLCLLPALVYLVLLAARFVQTRIDSMTAITRTFLMINALLNPLIYCWRQEEIRKFVFRISFRAVHPNRVISL
ncbi:melanocortin receptor 5-like [Montipora capricornis]|uniref:melanocortin receptor 5-like n=1 Tax=Montipora capricornis TaxID=246305 RepID=UPI0035F1E193